MAFQLKVPFFSVEMSSSYFLVETHGAIGSPYVPHSNFLFQNIYLRIFITVILKKIIEKYFQL